jgi:hypothetical protein
MSDGAILPIPSLNLSYTKETTTTSTSDQTQTANATNNNSITITVNPLASDESSTTQSTTTAHPTVTQPPAATSATAATTATAAATQGGQQAATVSKTTSDEETEKVSLFKDRLIEIQTELLLNNVDLVKNLVETTSNKVIYRKEHLQELIGILVLPVASRANYLKLVDIDTQPIRVQKFCCNFTHSIFEDITEITVNSTDNFLLTEIATKMEKIFKINLRRCIV